MRDMKRISDVIAVGGCNRVTDHDSRRFVM